MPVFQSNNYKPPFLFRNRHLNTISPTLFRNVNSVNYVRFRIETNDNDFIDFDRSSVNSKSVVIISHGLEGNSHKAYVKGIVTAANEIGIDAVAINLRGCSEEQNLLITSYHSGKTDDLHLIINHLISGFNYENIYLIGFSLGGNITLKYLGEEGYNRSNRIKGAVTVSVPCDLTSSAEHLNKWWNRIYLLRFLNSLKAKAIYKNARHGITQITENQIKNTKNFYQFDSLITAPLNGFKSAQDYWTKNSSIFYLKNITVPCLIISAQDDPILPKECYPYQEAANNPNLILEMPKYGGHVGFMTHYHFKQKLWHEMRIIEFLKQL